jgi:hypothetical protein
MFSSSLTINEKLCNSWLIPYHNQEFFFCHQCSTITAIKQSLPLYQCKKCGNREALDYNAIFNDKKTLYMNEFNINTHINKKRLHLTVEALIKYPIIEEGSIVFIEATLGKLYFSYLGKNNYQFFITPFHNYNVILENEVLNMYSFVQQKLIEVVLKFISKKENRPKNSSWLLENPRFKSIKSNKLKFQILNFFLQRPFLRELDFFFWEDFDDFFAFYKRYAPIKSYPVKERFSLINMLNFILEDKNSKALRKALYSHYQESIKLNFYNPRLDYWFTTHIQDRNYLKELILIKPQIKYYINKLLSKELYTLLEIFRSEKNLKNYLTSITRDDIREYIIRDTARVLSHSYLKEYILENNIKLPTNPKKFHDELIKIYNKITEAFLENSSYEYEEAQLNSEIKFKKLQFILPKNELELLKYAQTLSNCAYSYSNQIKNAQSTLYFIAKEDSVEYAIEIKEQSIIQAKAKYNHPIPQEDNAIINQWFYEVYLKNSLRSS